MSARTLLVLGCGRLQDNLRALLVSFSDKPTDDELRSFHDFIGLWPYHSRPGDGDGWQPIETAPTYEPLWLSNSDGSRMEKGQARMRGAIPCHHWATHWRPLPKGPAT